MSERWLHNMSSPSRTTVTSVQAAVHGRPVIFSLLVPFLRGEPALPLLIRQKLLAFNSIDLDDELLALGFDGDIAAGRLDPDPAETTAPWEGVLVGWAPFADVGGGAGPAAREEFRYCTDVALTVAVLARCEGNLYFGHRQPSGTLHQLLGREVCFDDPRIAHLDCLASLPSVPDPRAVAKSKANSP